MGSHAPRRAGAQPRHAPTRRPGHADLPAPLWPARLPGYRDPVSKPLELPFDPIARAAQTWSERFGPSGAMAAVTSIMRVQQILLAQLDAVLRPYELTFARYEALVLLTFSSRGTLPMRVIGERLMVHPTSATNTIDRLEGQGLVIRRPNPQDGRGKLAEITDRGREVVGRATDRPDGCRVRPGRVRPGPPGAAVRPAPRAAGSGR